MNGWLIALLLLGAAGLALLTKPREKRRRWPKPGEGMRPPGTPRGGRRNRNDRNGVWVELAAELTRVRGSVPAEEAHVLLGLLTSSGITARLRPSRGSIGHPRGAPSAYDVYVDRDRVDDARALLGG